MIRSVFCLLLLALPVRAQDFPAFYSVTGVADGDVLNIRIAPDPGSEIIGSLPPDATAVEVFGIQNGWASVNADRGGPSGFVLARYLAPGDDPPWNRLQTPLICGGTEPFWTLEIDPTAGEARFQSPDGIWNGDAPQVAAIDDLWAAEDWYGALPVAVATAFGLAVMRPTQCGDGMSDRLYGIEVNLFQSQPETKHFNGCCYLGR